MHWERGPKSLPPKTKLWLVVLLIVGLLFMALGGWVAQTTRNQKWLDDDELLLQNTIQRAQARSHVLPLQREAADDLSVVVKRYFN